MLWYAAQFRQAVRSLKLVGESNAAPSVDALFDQLDLDHSKDIDVSELAAAMKTLKAESAKAARLRENLEVQVERLSTLAVQWEKAVAAAEECEAAKVKMKEMSANPSVMQRVGAAMLKAGLKASEIALKWDVNGDGKIDRSEVINALRELGVQASDEELEGAVASMDKNQDGYYQAEELRAAFKALQEENAAFNQEYQLLSKNEKELRRVAIEEQQIAQAMEARDEAENAKAAAVAAAVAAAEAEAETKAKEEARAAKEAKEAKAKAKEEEMQKKVAEKRKAAPLTLDKRALALTHGAPADAPAGEAAVASVQADMRAHNARRGQSPINVS